MPSMLLSIFFFFFFLLPLILFYCLMPPFMMTMPCLLMLPAFDVAFDAMIFARFDDFLFFDFSFSMPMLRHFPLIFSDDARYAAFFFRHVSADAA